MQFVIVLVVIILVESWVVGRFVFFCEKGCVGIIISFFMVLILVCLFIKFGDLLGWQYLIFYVDGVIECECDLILGFFGFLFNELDVYLSFVGCIGVVIREVCGIQIVLLSFDYLYFGVIEVL